MYSSTLLLFTPSIVSCSDYKLGGALESDRRRRLPSFQPVSFNCANPPIRSLRIRKNISVGVGSDRVNCETEMLQSGESKIRHLFQKYDRKKSGFLGKLELKQIVADLGLEQDESQLAGLLQQFDSDGDSLWDFEEFKEFYFEVLHVEEAINNKKQEVEAIFNLLDKDRNDQIDWRELQDFMASLGMDLGEQETRSIIDYFDSNKNGALEYEEFEAFYLAVIDKRGEPNSS